MKIMGSWLFLLFGISEQAWGEDCPTWGMADCYFYTAIPAAVNRFLSASVHPLVSMKLRNLDPKAAPIQDYQHICTCINFLAYIRITNREFGRNRALAKNDQLYVAPLETWQYSSSVKELET
jgi:hypothetical protein